MIEQAWTVYRGWAARAREQQAATQMWNRIALFMVVLTAFLGTFSSQFDKQSRIVFWIAMASAVIAAVSGWLGREALAVESETKWVKARGFAEAIKSECFRFAGGVGAYAGRGAAASKAFRDRFRVLREEISDLDIAPGDPTPPAGGSAPPPDDMTRDWYLENRLKEQRRYFDKTLARSARKVAMYRMIALGSMVLAALCSAAVGLDPSTQIAPWTGVITTISAAFIAAGMNERAQAISSAAVRTINRLDDILIEWDVLSLAELVDQTEDALQDENMQWRETMRKTRAAAVAAAARHDGGDGSAPGADPPADEPADGALEDRAPAAGVRVEDPPVDAPPADEADDSSGGGGQPGEETPDRPPG